MAFIRLLGLGVLRVIGPDRTQPIFGEKRISSDQVLGYASHCTSVDLVSRDHHYVLNVNGVRISFPPRIVPPIFISSRLGRIAILIAGSGSIPSCLQNSSSSRQHSPPVSFSSSTPADASMRLANVSGSLHVLSITIRSISDMVSCFVAAIIVYLSAFL